MRLISYNFSSQPFVNPAVEFELTSAAVEDAFGSLFKILGDIKTSLAVIVPEEFVSEMTYINIFF